MSQPAKVLAVSLAAFALSGLLAGSAAAHGDDEMATEDLAQQPARTLAQQALAELEVRADSEEAAARLDAAVESQDQQDVDPALVNQAMEMVDAGNPEGAIPVLDRALSKPLGEAEGAALHESGRTFQPSGDAQEIVAIIVGAVLLLLGLWAVGSTRRRKAS